MKILNKAPFKAGDVLRVTDRYLAYLRYGQIVTVHEVYRTGLTWFVKLDAESPGWFASRFRKVSDEDTE